MIRYVEFEHNRECWVCALTDGAEMAGRLLIVQRELPYGQTSTIRYGEIRTLHVEVEHRRNGIARELVRRALDYAARQGWERVAVEASAKPGTPGSPTYAALGFTPRSEVWDIEIAERGRR